jgi:hypothetical protein
MTAKREIRGILIKLLIAVLCLIALGVIVAILVGRVNDTAARIFLSAIAVAFYSVLALASLSVLDRRPWMTFLGFGIYVIACVVALLGIWVDWNSDDGILDWIFSWLVISVASAHVTLLESRRREGDSRSVTAIFFGTIACIALLTLLLVIPLFGNSGESDRYWRLVGVIAVVDVLGTLLLPLLRRLQSDRSQPVSAGN